MSPTVLIPVAKALLVLVPLLALAFAGYDLMRGVFDHIGGKYVLARERYKEGLWWGALIGWSAVVIAVLVHHWSAWVIGPSAILLLVVNGYLCSVTKRFMRHLPPQ